MRLMRFARQVASGLAVSGLLTSTISAAPFLYLPDEFWNTVGVVDVSGWKLIANIPLGSFPSAVAVLPTAGNVYVANGRYVSVIDGKTHTLAATINVGNASVGIAASPDGARVYVTSLRDDTATIIDTSTNRVISSINVGASPWGIAVSPDSSRVYVANSSSNDLSVINATSRAVVATIPVGRYPVGVSVAPNGSRVYVANQDNNSVSIINTVSNAVVATLPVGRVPQGLAVSADSRRVVVANSGSNSVSVIDTSSNSVIATATVGSGPIGVAFSPDGADVYVGNYNSSSISVLDAQTFALKSSVPIRLGAVAGLLSPFGAFVSTQNAASIPFLQDMIEFRYTPLDYVFMTSRSSEISALDQAAGWVRTGLRFKVLSSAGVSGTIPLYRYFFAQVARQATRGTHFYTAVASEIEALRVANPTNSSAPRLPYNEGIDSYVYPPLVEGIGGSCATNQSPIYRLFRGPTRFPDDANHRFTSDKSLYDSYVKGGWDGEGVKFCAPI